MHRDKTAMHSVVVGSSISQGGPPPEQLCTYDTWSCVACKKCTTWTKKKIVHVLVQGPQKAYTSSLIYMTSACKMYTEIHTHTPSANKYSRLQKGKHIVHGLVHTPCTVCMQKLDEPLSVKFGLQCTLNGKKQVSRQSAIELFMPSAMPPH